MSYQQPVVVYRQHENSGAHIAISWVVTVLTGFYMLPWAIAATRHKENTGTIALLNVFLGWSGIGWIVSLVLACLSDPIRQPIIQGYATPAPPPRYQPVARPALEASSTFPAYQPPPPPFQGHQPGYQAPYGQPNPYHSNPYQEPARHPEASPYGDPVPQQRQQPPYAEPPGIRPEGGNTQFAFGMNSTDPFSTFPAVEQQVPTVEGTIEDGRRG